MIEINLLPEAMRKQKKAYSRLDLEIAKIKFLAGGVVVGLLILLLLVFSIGSCIRKRQILSFTENERLIAPQRSQVEALNKELSILKGKMAALDEVTRRKFLWAKKLNELSDLVLPGIWFTRIRTNLDETFMIEGSVISKKEEAMASVGKFMKDIKEHASFFGDFSNIKLESVQRKSMDGRDIVDFKIALHF